MLENKLKGTFLGGEGAANKYRLYWTTLKKDCNRVIERDGEIEREREREGEKEEEREEGRARKSVRGGERKRERERGRLSG